MGPTADARTDRMVYADCRRDYRITETIYINNVALSSNINFATSEKKRSANCGPLYFYKQKSKEMAFPTLVAMRTKQQVVKCCPPTDVGRAIF